MQFGDIIVVIDHGSVYWARAGEVTGSTKDGRLRVQIGGDVVTLDPFKVELGALVPVPNLGDIAAPVRLAG